MNSSPLVTVVIPTWNRLPFVEGAVRSVLAQTYRAWELIVVDDGSTDGTVERLSALSDARVKVLSGPHVGHIGVLRNTGARAGAGELIAFLDSDDVWLPDKLEIQIGALERSEAGWCYGGFELIDANGERTPVRAGCFTPLSGQIVRELLTTDASVAVQSLVVRRAVFDAVGGFSEHPQLMVRGDHELHLRLAVHAEAVAVPDVLVRIREHAGRTMSMLVDPHENTARVYEFFLAHVPDLELASLARQMQNRHLSSAGAQRLAAGHPIRAGRFFWRSLSQGAEPRAWARAVARGLKGFVQTLFGGRGSARRVR